MAQLGLLITIICILIGAVIINGRVAIITKQQESQYSEGFPITIRVHYKTNSPQFISKKEIGVSTITIRGNISPLSWTQGISLIPTNQKGVYERNVSISLSELQRNSIVELKSLVNDQVWQLGANSQFDLSQIVMARKTLNGRVPVLDIYPWFFTYEGNIITYTGFYSPQFNNYRNVSVYYPPSYFENDLKTFDNILIMHDGQNLFDPSTAFINQAWMIQQTLNPLMTSSNTQNSIEELIVIGVDNTAKRMEEYTYSKDPQYGGGKGELYLDFLEKQVIPPLMAKNFRWFLNGKKLGILGSSLGGLISCYAGWTRPTIYDKIGCMSSSFWWNNQDFNNTILNNPKIPSGVNIYLDSGNKGEDNDDETQTIAVRNHILSFKQYFKYGQNVFYYLDDGGQHNEYYWGKRFWAPMLSLYSVKPKVIN